MREGKMECPSKAFSFQFLCWRMLMSRKQRVVRRERTGEREREAKRNWEMETECKNEADQTESVVAGC